MGRCLLENGNGNGVGGSGWLKKGRRIGARQMLDAGCDARKRGWVDGLDGVSGDG